VLEDGATSIVFEKELKKRFDNFPIPEQEMTEEKKAAIEVFKKIRPENSIVIFRKFDSACFR
jgi:hypothetical protein